jgi:tetratricopeptide (TPR) repeat protein
MIRLLMISLLFISCKGNATQIAKSEAISYPTQIEQIKSDTLLVRIQSKIYSAFIQSLMSKGNKPLSKLSEKLEELNKTKKQNLILYWRSYLQFYSSIYYLKKGDKKSAEKEIDKGIDWLKELKNKNSEDYALLAMLQGFGIQFKGMKAMFISGDIKKNLKKAIAIDTTNLRAYYVYASNDFHTPKKYGGGKETEEYLLKAISLSVQKVKNDYLPSWGKEESFEMLIKFYINNEKWDFAKKYYQEGIKEFPESYTISQLATKLVGK